MNRGSQYGISECLHPGCVCGTGAGTDVFGCGQVGKKLEGQDEGEIFSVRQGEYGFGCRALGCWKELNVCSFVSDDCFDMNVGVFGPVSL